MCYAFKTLALFYDEIVVLLGTGMRVSEFCGLTRNELDFDNEMRWAYKRYCRLHADAPLPKVTPHVLRHTFCTNMANAGMKPKTLQYLMGHSKINVTLDCIYAQHIRSHEGTDDGAGVGTPFTKPESKAENQAERESV